MFVWKYSQLFQSKLKIFVFCQCIADLGIFLCCLEKFSDLQHIDLPRTGSYMGFGRHLVRPGTMPNLGMADREFELKTASDMGSSEMEFGLETRPVTLLAE